jgi:hypothetical protein
MLHLSEMCLNLRLTEKLVDQLLEEVSKADATLEFGYFTSFVGLESYAVTGAFVG